MPLPTLIDLVRASKHPEIFASHIARLVIGSDSHHSHSGHEAHELLVTYLLFLAFDPFFPDEERTIDTLLSILADPGRRHEVLVAMGNGSNVRMVRASIHMQEYEGDELKESDTLHRAFYLRVRETLDWWS